MAGYGDDTTFAAWLTANGYSLPAGGLDPAVLRQRGSVYLDGLYGDRFPGVPTGGLEQDRAWPRTGAEDVYGNAIAANAIPTRVVHASYEAAYLDAVKPGILSTTYTPAQQKVLTEVKGIKWTVVGESKGAQSAVMVSTKIEGLLAPLTGTSLLLPAILVV
ncbi:hypothetical protein OEG84_25115 [Hoeflea sp. G2-23]|uniref:Putative DnaT-like domain-containing protein n=1 Tax=Hoeflea algicola TaxID=2983763 RepID=A0ABT3ZI05_9HYPH|nr:DnaT-like ssDNA-binding protein [Hoeflea algicola]MCY0150889.1 hypothetical protein [Hoeflea algicola]